MIEPLLSGYLKREKRKISSSLGSLAEDGIESLYKKIININIYIYNIYIYNKIYIYL